MELSALALGYISWKFYISAGDEQLEFPNNPDVY
jgi:hypothetical protein